MISNVKDLDNIFEVVMILNRLDILDLGDILREVIHEY